MAPGILYVVSTPIGNLGDLSFRAVETLKSVDAIACEDTRRTKLLLDHYGIQRPLFSFFDHSEKRKAPAVVRRLREGQTLALVSDAGTPGIADPGFRLIREALEAGVRVETVPGPAALLAALVLSGLPMNRFAFEGFLPVKKGARERFLESLKHEDRTVIVYESPHRVLETLRIMQKVMGDVPVVVARELTKKFEEVRRGLLSEHLAHFSARKILGEFVILWNRLGP